MIECYDHFLKHYYSTFAQRFIEKYSTYTEPIYFASCPNKVYMYLQLWCKGK